MKYALISDIHANLPALEAVLADIDREAKWTRSTTSATWWATPPGPTRSSP